MGLLPRLLLRLLPRLLRPRPGPRGASAWRVRSVAATGTPLREQSALLGKRLLEVAAADPTGGFAPRLVQLLHPAQLGRSPAASGARRSGRSRAAGVRSPAAAGGSPAAALVALRLPAALD